MSGTVVIKLGGGLITDKEKICTPNLEAIDKLCQIISMIDRRVILVHGAGSFGHMKSKRYRLAEGRIVDMQQDSAVLEVRNDMMVLNSIIKQSLEKYGIKSETFPPREWVRGTGPEFSGELPLSKDVTIVFGDVVPDPQKEFGILSGDDLMYRYSTEIEDVDHAIFAMGGADGLLRVPPELATDEDLFEIWSPDMKFDGLHAEEFDVTGGIGLKATRGAMIASKGIDVWLVNGKYPERILEIIGGKNPTGTKIISGNC